MDNVTKRSLRAEMGDAFEGWAEGFFATTEQTLDSEGTLKYLDNYFSKDFAFEEFIKATKQGKWSSHKFKKAMKAYCQLNDYILNPKDLHNATGRIIQKLDGKAQEVFFIRTIEKPDVAKQVENVKEYSNEDEIFND